jgi:cytochrome P450
MNGLRMPPGPKGLPFIGHFHAYRSDPAGFLLKLTHQYGDIVYFRLGRHSVYLLNHPEYIKDVLVTRSAQFSKGRVIQRGKKILGEGLVTSEGAWHRRQRRIVQPAFHRSRIAAYGETMAKRSAWIRNHWQEGVESDIEQDMTGLTMSIVTKTLFDVDVESEAPEIGDALRMMRKGFPFMLLPGAEWLDLLPIPVIRRFQRAMGRLDATIYGMIDERRRSRKDRGDLLSMLLVAQDAEEGGGMTDRQVRDEVITLFLAGHETTTSALTWTWYLLSQHPDVEAMLHAELDAVLTGRLPETDDVPALTYTRMALTEAMRLYPPVGKMGYRVIGEYDVGGYRLPVGSTVWLSQYAMRHDPR